MGRLLLLFSERELTKIAVLSPVRLSVVCRFSDYNVRAPYSAGCNFMQCFYAMTIR